jgi:hypothetical protein
MLSPEVGQNGPSFRLFAEVLRYPKTNSRMHCACYETCLSGKNICNLQSVEAQEFCKDNADDANDAATYAGGTLEPLIETC